MSRGKLYERFAEVSLAEADYRRGIQLCSDQLQAKPADTELLYQRAWFHQRFREYSQSVADYHQILQTNPGDAKSYNALAWLHAMGPSHLRDPAAALRFAKQAVQLGTDWHYLGTLGTVEFRLGEWQKSMRTTLAAIVANKGEGTAFEYFVLAMCYQKLGDESKARESFDRALVWIKRETDLSPDWDEDLQMLRAEAELVLNSSMP
jgi:tetratricopeptide (TPR) repeat protein